MAAPKRTKAGPLPAGEARGRRRDAPEDVGIPAMRRSGPARILRDGIVRCDFCTGREANHEP